ncbi:MAG: metal-dependent hydrolase [Halohasta sp.]
MYRMGHLGVSMLVFAPVGYALVAAGHPAVAAVAGLVMIQFATVPDIDHRLPMVDHRGATHSLAFAALAGAVGAAVGIVAGSIVSVDLPLPAIGFAVGALTILAHLLGDTLTPMGVNYLWPLPASSVSLSLTRADNPWANRGLFGLGLAVTAGWVAVVGGVV